MERKETYISKVDFDKSTEFIKIDQHINTCLKLIERLVKYNDECLRETKEQLQVDKYIIDYRIEQFKHFKNTLSAVFYNCFSLKYVYEISASMRLFQLDTTIGLALRSQIRTITLNFIVQIVGTFEFTRKKYEQEIKGKNYYNALKEKYPKLGESLELLINFRNTIHSNGIWNNKNPLEYKLQKGTIIIKDGKPIIVEIWLLYRLIWDCIKLSKLMALDNKPAYYRETHLTSGGEKIVVLQIDKNDVNKLFNSINKLD